MNHRKIVHPSFKRCRKFDFGSCTRGDDCWYSHEEGNSLETTANRFKCNLCDNTFDGIAPFMIHKKEMHQQFVPECEKFSLRKCPRGSSECWFIHTANSENKHKESKNNSQTQSVFSGNQQNNAPPNSKLQMIGLIEKLHLKINTILESKQ